MNIFQSIHNKWINNPRVQMLVAQHFTLGFMDDFKAILKTAGPLLLCNVSQVFFPMVSLFFCGHLGQNEFDGVSIGFTLINVFGLSFVYGLLSACDTLFPQIYGGPNKKLLGLFLQKSLIIQVIMCIPVIGLLFNSRNVMLLMVKDKEIAFIAYDYIRYYMPSILFINVANVLIKYVQSQNIVNPLMVINLANLVLNTLLHVLFIFGLKMGVIGAAIAVDISCFSLMTALFVFIYYKKLYVSTWNGWSLECLYDWKIYLKLAIPGFLTLLIEWTNFEIGTFVSSTISEVELGAMSICQQVIYICFQFPFTLATAGNIHIGQLLGSNSPAKAQNATKVLYVISIGTCLCLALFVTSISTVLPSAFTSDPEIVARTKPMMLMCALIHLFDGGQGICAGVLRTVGAQLYSSISIFVCFYVIGSPIGVVLSIKTSLLIYGFLIGVIIGCSALIGAQIFYILRIDWVQKAQEAYDLSKTNENEIIRKLSLNSAANTLGKVEMAMTNPNFDGISLSDMSKKAAANGSANPFDQKDNELELSLGDAPKSLLIPPLVEHFKSAAFVKVLLKRLLIVCALVAIFIALFLMRGLNKYDNTPMSPMNATTSQTQVTASYEDFKHLDKFFYRFLAR